MSLISLDFEEDPTFFWKIYVNSFFVVNKKFPTSVENVFTIES